MTVWNTSAYKVLVFIAINIDCEVICQWLPKLFSPNDWKLHYSNLSVALFVTWFWNWSLFVSRPYRTWCIIIKPTHHSKDKHNLLYHLWQNIQGTYLGNCLKLLLWLCLYTSLLALLYHIWKSSELSSQWHSTRCYCLKLFRDNQSCKSWKWKFQKNQNSAKEGRATHKQQQCAISYSEELLQTGTHIM
jgi:hypothetical protein